MKPILLLAFGLVTLGSQPVFSQPQQARSSSVSPFLMEPFQSPQPAHGIVTTGAMLPGHTAKATNTSSRIIGSTYASNSGGAYVNGDSIAYVYSGTRGGDLSSSILYDTSWYFNYDTVHDAWTPLTRYIATYNSQNMLVSLVTQSWYATSSVFKNANRETVTYNPDNTISHVLNESWDLGTNTWVNYMQYIGYTYNAQKKWLTQTGQQWSPSTSAWVNTTRETNTYDATGNKITKALQELWATSTSSWEYSSQAMYGYDGSGNVSTYVAQYWSTTSSSWKNSQAVDYHYDLGTGAIKSIFYRIGDATGAGWVNTDSMDNTILNSVGMPLEQNHYSWHTNGWGPVTHTTFTYTGGGRLEANYVTQNWNGSGFDDASRRFSQYNGFGQLTDRYTETKVAGSWVISTPDYHSRYYYQSFDAAVPTTSALASQIQVSPNPAHEEMRVSATGLANGVYQLSVFDPLGRLITQQMLAASGNFDFRLSTAQWDNGIYFLRLAKGDDSRQIPFVVHH